MSIRPTHWFPLLCLMSALCAPAHAQNDFWEPTGGPTVGPVNNIVFNGAGDVFLVSDRLWRSQDRGSHWTDVNGTLPAGKITKILIAADNTIFVIATDVYRSTNNGDSWTKVVGGYHFVDLQSAANGTLYAAVSTGTDGPVLISHDNGTTWSGLHAVIGEPASVTHLCVTPSGMLILDVGQYFYRSTDNGFNWTKQINSSIAGYGIGAATVSGALFTATPTGIYRSTDNARTWTQLFSDVTELVYGGADSVIVYKTTGRYVNSVFVLFDTLFTSTDAGNSWNAEKPHVRETQLGGGEFATYDRRAHTLVYCSNRAWTYTVRFVSTSAESGIDLTVRNSSINAILSPTTGVVLANDGNSFCRSTDAGDHWIDMSSGSQAYNGGDIWNLGRDSSGNLLAAKASGVSLSSDNGATWRAFRQNVNYSSGAIKFMTAPNSSMFLYGPETGLVRTTDHGATWDLLAQQFLTKDIAVFNCDNAGNIYIGISTGFLPGNIYRSTDNGDTWASSLAIQDTSLMDLSTLRMTAIVPTADGGMELATTDHGMLHVSADGTHWSSDNAGLDNESVFSMQNTASGDLYAVSSRNGKPRAMIYRPANGTRWYDVPQLTTISFAQVNVWTVGPDGTIYLGTGGKGVWRSHGLVNAIRSIATSPTLTLTIQPNPAHDLVTLRYSGASSAEAQITVIDLLGRARIRQTRTAAIDTPAETALDLTGLIPGSYRLVITSGGSVAATQLIVR